MTSTELIEVVRQQGLYPIRVKGGADRAEESSIWFAGSIQEYFDASKALEAKTVFIYVDQLEEDDFLYDLENNPIEQNGFDSEDEDGEPFANASFAEINLTTTSPSLSEFKKYLGQECIFCLRANSQITSLNFRIEEEWWKQFVEERDKAIKKVEADEASARAKMVEAQLEKEKWLIKLLKSLAQDEEFVRIPTQRSMKVYALEKHPELEELGDGALTYQIQLLSDKINPRRPHRKTR